jgi:hypothetical protein
VVGPTRRCSVAQTLTGHSSLSPKAVAHTHQAHPLTPVNRRSSQMPAGRAVQSAPSLGFTFVHGIPAGPSNHHTQVAAYFGSIGPPAARRSIWNTGPSRTCMLRGRLAVRLMVQDGQCILGAGTAYPSVSHTVSANSRTQGHTGIDDDQKLMIHARKLMRVSGAGHGHDRAR